MATRTPVKYCASVSPARYCAKERFPSVPVGVDEAGDGDLVGGVDHLRVAGLEVGGAIAAIFVPSIRMSPR